VVRSLPTPNRLEKGLDRPQPTTHYTQNPRCDESAIPTTTNQQDKDHTGRNHIHLQTGRGTHTYVREPEHPRTLLHILESILGRSFARIPAVPSMGPCNRAQTRRTGRTPRQTYPVITSRTRGTPKIRKRAHGKRDNSTIEKPVQSSVLLHQKEGQKTSTSTGLLTRQPMDHS
jgi:hypothetical protein